MPTTRKKWRTVTQPTNIEKRHPSENKVYEYVRELQAAFPAGGEVTAVQVYVDEGTGRWLNYELCDFTGEWAPLPRAGA